MQYVFAHVDNNLSEMVVLIVCGCVGAFVGLFLVCFKKVGIAAVGAVCGVLLMNLLWQFTLHDAFHASWVPWLVMGLSAVLGALCAITFTNTVIRLCTAFIGGFLAAASLGYGIARLRAHQDKTTMKQSWMDIAQFFGRPSTYEDIGRTCEAACWCSIGIRVLFFIVGSWHQTRACFFLPGGG